MRIDSSRFVPVWFEFEESAARQNSWGRFTEMRPDGAVLMTRTPLHTGEHLYLHFDLPLEKISSLGADVRKIRIDEDGYSICQLTFPNTEDKVKLGRVLRRILTSG